MVQTVDDDEKGICNVYSLGGNQDCMFLTENGLHEVLMLSRKPIAKKFKKGWNDEKGLDGKAYIPWMYELRVRLAREECDAGRYRDWRSHVGRKPKGWLPLEEQMSLF